MELDSLIKKHKLKMSLQGIGALAFGSVGVLMTYNVYKVVSYLREHNIEVPTTELLPSLNEQINFGDMMFANAVALAFTLGLGNYAKKNYDKVKELKQQREIKKYF
jgi:hypothetical protein